MQHTAARCNALQHTAAHCNKWSCAIIPESTFAVSSVLHNTTAVLRDSRVTTRPSCLTYTQMHSHVTRIICQRTRILHVHACIHTCIHSRTSSFFLSAQTTSHKREAACTEHVALKLFCSSSSIAFRPPRAPLSSFLATAAHLAVDSAGSS